jgi:phosphoribosyl 1,2-cyclic phosphate phosphodiesterase
MHGKLPILGYRIGKLAYITDMKTIEESEYPYLEGTELLVVNALRFTKPHHSHQLVDDALAFAHRVGAKQTLLIHVCHDIGLHESVDRLLPEGVQLAYDGQEVIL